jgi:EAL domain-containing protein (putative c-di-GMP-specific phosphodiesterase class I)
MRKKGKVQDAWRRINMALDPWRDASDAARAERLDMRGRVARAIATDRLCLALQPVVASGDGHRTAFHEGLIRMIDDDGHLIAAGLFMPHVEGSALGREIDCVALRLAIAALADDPGLRLSINVDPRTAGDAAWMAILDEASQSRPDICYRLIVELTETALLHQTGAVDDFIDAVHAAGASVALDDYGAGATAIRSFRDYRFEFVKIDGSFVTGIARSPDSQAIVTALVSMAQHFDMVTVAERVETADDAAMLHSLGVDCLQGYLFGEPEVRGLTALEAWGAGGAA